MPPDCRIAVFDGELRLLWFNRSAAEDWSLTSDDLGTAAEQLSRGRSWSWVDRLPAALAAGRATSARSGDRLLRFEPGVDRRGGIAVADQAGFARDDDAANIEAMWRRLGKMASVVAHEVKNPLAGVSGALHVLANRFSAGSQDRQIVEEMQSRLSGLNSTLDELLLFARPVRVNSGRAPIRLVVDRAVDSVRSDPELPTVPIVVRGEGPELQMDADLVTRAIRSLLVNAVQASPPDESVTVDVSAADGRVQIVVRDEGRGVSDEIASMIFEPFFTRKSRGAGLGLTVARRIVEAHSGALRLVASPRGAEFRLELPIQLRA